MDKNERITQLQEQKKNLENQQADFKANIATLTAAGKTVAKQIEWIEKELDGLINDKIEKVIDPANDDLA